MKKEESNITEASDKGNILNDIVPKKTEKIKRAHIEKAKISDVPELIRLYTQLNPDVDFQEVQPMMFEQYFSDLMINKNINLFVIRNKDKILSTCMFTIIPNFAQGLKPNGIVESFVTDKDSRRKGYGRIMLQYIIETAKDYGCLKISLLTKNDNESIKIYEDFGFKENDRRSFIKILD